MAEPNRTELLDFLEHRVFEPIMHSSSDRYSESERKDLDYVKRATERQRDRYRGYRTGEEIVDNFKDDLQSEAARTVNDKLERLNLPRFADVQDEFLRKAGAR